MEKLSRLDFIDVIFGLSLIILVIGLVLGKTTMEEVVTFLAAIGLKQAPSTIFQKQKEPEPAKEPKPAEEEPLER